MEAEDVEVGNILAQVNQNINNWEACNSMHHGNNWVELNTPPPLPTDADFEEMARLPTPTESLDLDEILDMLEENGRNNTLQPNVSNPTDPYEFVPESPQPGPSHRPDPPPKRKADNDLPRSTKRTLLESR